MTTILLCWYALGIFICGVRAQTDGKISVGDIVYSILFSPVYCVLSLINYPFIVFQDYSDKILWERKQ